MSTPMFEHLTGASTLIMLYCILIVTHVGVINEHANVAEKTHHHVGSANQTVLKPQRETKTILDVSVSK